MSARSLTLLIAANFLGLVVLSSDATTQQPQVLRKSIFSSLKDGKAVTLREKGNLFEIETMDEIAPLTHRIVEIGDDYIVICDESELVVSRIPVTTVRAVVHMKTKAK